MVYLTQALQENGLCIEWFHRGRFLIGRQFEEITFWSKDAFNTVERRLSRIGYYTIEGSNGEEYIDTEDGIWDDCFDTEGGGGEDGSEGSIIQCTFVLIKMTSELYTYVMKQQAGVSCGKSTNRKLSL